NPILPSSTSPDGSFVFTDVQSGLWFDPSFANGYTYTMTSSSLFTAIEGFPSGFSQAFDVSVGGVSLGQFGPGQTASFTQLLGHAVSCFPSRGFSPLADAADLSVFPLKLGFNTATASFTMTPIVPAPEPLSLTLWAFSCVGLCVARAMRRRPHFAA